MDKKRIIWSKNDYVYQYYLELWVHCNKPKFYNLFLCQIYNKILSDRTLIYEFTEFLSMKMSELAYNKTERRRVLEKWLSEWN
jgi:hypothetical protein